MQTSFVPCCWLFYLLIAFLARQFCLTHITSAAFPVNAMPSAAQRPETRAKSRISPNRCASVYPIFPLYSLAENKNSYS